MSEKKSVEVVPGALEGARRASGGAPGAAADPAPKRWSANRKKETVLRRLRGEPLEALSRELGVEIYRLEAWREQALAGMDAGLKARHNDPLEDKLAEAAVVEPLAAADGPRLAAEGALARDHRPGANGSSGTAAVQGVDLLGPALSPRAVEAAGSNAARKP